MKASKVLEMINNNRIEELKEELRDEIYNEALKSKPGAKQRFNAMKRYFKYTDSVRECCQKPCMIEFEGETRTSFCNSYSLALTKEPCGPIELFTDVNHYPNVGKLVRYDGDEAKIDFTAGFAKAKSLGYKLTKKEVQGQFQYLFKYNNAYFKVGLVDITYHIIDDGNPPTVFQAGVNKPMTIQNDIGTCYIMPVRSDGEFEIPVTIIELD